MTEIMPHARASATFTVKIIYQSDARPGSFTASIEHGIPTATIGPRSNVNLGEWMDELATRLVRLGDRLIGDADDFEIIVRPGQPATIDATDGSQSYHGTLGDDEWDAPRAR